MTNKTKTILLIVVAIAVWGYAGMEWFSYLNNNDSVDSFVAETNDVSVINYLVETDEYSPEFNYADPFIKKDGIKPKVSKKNVPISTGQSNNKSVFEPKPIVDDKSASTIDITYKGTISADNRVVGLLQINNESHAVSVGDVVKGMIVLELTSESVLLQTEEGKISVNKD